jgi:hypothetical protein
VSFSTVSIEHGQMMMECSSLAQVFILTNKKSEIEERYWQRLTELFSKNEKLKSCIAVCDTSEGVSGTIVDEFGLYGLLIYEVIYNPWREKIFTFSEHPKLCKINVLDGRLSFYK